MNVAPAIVLSTYFKWKHAVDFVSAATILPGLAREEIERDDRMHWTEGYVTELEFIYTYYPVLCPGILRLACLSAGVVPPAGKPLRYLELGYGQGLSLNIHAAAVPGEFWGTDFNPAHATQARAFAEASGSGAKLFDDSFAEFASRSDLPEFDIISLHGIWTCISNENNRTIVDLIRRKLHPGGIVYMGYNCLPGCVQLIPLRHLVKLHADLAAEAPGMLAKFDGAVTFARQVIDSGAFYFRDNPAVGKWLKPMRGRERINMAHLFFAQNFRPMAFSDVAKWLDDAKLSFVASANLLDHVDALNIKPGWNKLLAEIKHPIVRESVRDYFVNQQLRCDVFIKGPRRLSGLEQQEAIMSDSFALTTHADDVPMKVKGALGEAPLAEQVYRPVIEALAENDYAPKTVAQLATHIKLKAIPFPQIFQSMFVLTGAGHVHPVQASTSVTRNYCHALNRYLCERARSTGDIRFLASPVTGGGVHVPRFHQLLLLALQHYKKSEAEQADFVWALLSAQGQRMIRDGKMVESPEENVKELTNVARHFATRLPLLKALEIA